MQRPAMHAVLVHEGPEVRRRWWHWFFLPIGWLVRGFFRLLTADIFGRPRRKIRVDVGTPLGRFAKRCIYRSLFLPPLVALVVVGLVYTGTHPPAVASAMDPTYRGVYYDPVSFSGEDSTPLDAWLIPVVDARRVLLDRDKILQGNHPGIVLVHDFGASRQQMLPLVAPLHDAGYAVLVVQLRGNSLGANAGFTFGINEAGDVRAAVHVLRRTPFIDQDHVAVLGIGTGATACILAAQRDDGIAALVLDRPLRSFDEALRAHILPPQPWLHWMAPLCEWTFNLSYGVNSSDLNLDRAANVLYSRPVLLFDGHATSAFRTEKSRQIVDFLNVNLKPKKRG